MMQQRRHLHAALCCCVLLLTPLARGLDEASSTDHVTALIPSDGSITSSSIRRLAEAGNSSTPAVGTELTAVQQTIANDSSTTPSIGAAATIQSPSPRPPPARPPPPANMKQCTWDGYTCQFFINYAWAIVRPDNMTAAGLDKQRDIDDMAGFYMWGCTVHRERAPCIGDKYHKCVWEKSTNSCWVDVGFTQSYLAKNYMCTDNEITLFTRCALVPTAEACVATWGCRVTPAPRRATRRLQGESQLPACVPWWFLDYNTQQQEDYLNQVDDPEAPVWKPCPNARFAYAYKTVCDLDTPAACNAVPHCTWRDSAFKCSVRDQGVLAFWYKSPQNSANLVGLARTCEAITNWKKCDQLQSAPTRTAAPMIFRPPRPPPPPPKGTVSRAAGINSANVQGAGGADSMKMGNMSLQTMPTNILASSMSKSTISINAAAQPGVPLGWVLLHALGLAFACLLF